MVMSQNANGIASNDIQEDRFLTRYKLPLHILRWPEFLDDPF